MSLPIFAYWSDNIIPGATLSSGAAGSSSPITGSAYANVGDGDPSHAAIAQATSFTIMANFGGARIHALVGVIHHNVAPALSVFQWQAHTSDAWTSPDSNLHITAGAIEADGYHPDVWLRPAVTKQYARLAVASNTANVAIGEIFVSQVVREFPNGFSISGAEDGADVETLEHLTYAKVSLRTKKGFRRNIHTGTIVGTEAEIGEALDWFRAVSGRAEPIFLVPDPDAAYCLLCILDQDSIRRRARTDGGFEVSVTFRQLSRGLAWA